MSAFDEEFAAFQKNRVFAHEQSFRHGWNAALRAAIDICQNGDIDTNGNDYANAIQLHEVEVQT